MTEFEYFLKENNYEDDLEFQLCDLEVAFDEGMRIGKSQNTWKPSIEQMKALRAARATFGVDDVVLASLIYDLEKLTE